MLITKQIDLGEYIIVVEYNDDGSGYLKVTVLDELDEEVDFIEVVNDNEGEIDPKLN